MNHTSTRSRCGTVSSASRGVFAGGAHNTSSMEYITPSTLGNGTALVAYQVMVRLLQT